MAEPSDPVDLPDKYDYLAPDGSEIRLLRTYACGGLSHCTLPVNATSLPVRHATVEEIWYVLDGEGELWRRLGDRSNVVELRPGRSVGIDRCMTFQFRTTGDKPLRILISTMPAWPGDGEAGPDKGEWAVPVRH